MPDQVKNALIGVFVISALAILVFSMMFLHPRVGDQEQVLKVRFSNIDKINVGTRVTFAGRPVGEVISIEEIDAPRTEKYFGEYVYTYELTLVVDSNITIFNSDEISLRTSGLLGERSVAITPHKPKRGIRLRRVQSGDILYATEAGSLEETFAEFNNFAEHAEEAFDAVLDMLEDIKQSNLWDNVGKTAENLNDITTALNSPDDWGDTLANFRSLSEKANSLADRVTTSWDDIDETFENMVVVSEDLVTITADGKEISGKTAKGEGTLGRLLAKDDMYLNLNSLMSKGNTLMDDINHYGLLFQNDAHWQRLRARRRNIMQELCTPQEFRNFFEDEINQITTSLCRVHNIMDDTACCCPGGSLMCDPDFVKVFAELLRRVKALEENVEMYNQQIIDAHEECCCY